MKLFSLSCIAALAAVTLISAEACALTQDDKSMNTSDGAPRFSDPDEKTPGQSLYMQDGKAASSGEDPSGVRYEYDPSSGGYVATHKQQ